MLTDLLGFPVSRLRGCFVTLLVSGDRALPVTDRRRQLLVDDGVRLGVVGRGCRRRESVAL